MSLTVSHGLDDEQKEIQSLALDFAQREMAPNMELWDREVSDLFNLVVLV